jgi:lactoylglutathione lyase
VGETLLPSRTAASTVSGFFKIVASKRVRRRPLAKIDERGDPPLRVKYLHTMVRVKDLSSSLEFYCDKLGLKEIRRVQNEKGRFTLVFLAAPGDESAQVELTHNWDAEELTGGRNFGHLAYEVANVYETCGRLAAAGVTILRPPRDGRMAFIRSPDDVSIELLQKGAALPPQEPWTSMPNVGTW